jgi:hypothetical protein
MDIIEIEPDDINLNNINIPTFSDNEDDIDDIIQRPSSNFGSGIELLMNDKNKNEKKSTNIDIEDISKLEDELNELTSDFNLGNSNIKKINNDTKNNETKNIQTKNNETKNIETDDDIDIGKKTAKIGSLPSKSWDGYTAYNDVPNDDKIYEKKKLSPEEELREKFKYIKKFEELEKKGVSTTKKYNMDSDLNEMIGEYESIVAEKEKSNSVKFQAKMLMACITGIEFLNNKFDPFDLKLDGWSEQINENIDEYDDIFAELHEKYKSKSKMSPELRLLFQLGGSATMIHMSNTLFKSAMPGMDDIMRQNPELMKQFTSAAVNTMGQNNPGFSGFMNNMFTNNNNNNNASSGYTPGFGASDIPPNINNGPPPPATETKLPERSRRVPNIPNRPDIMNARNNEGISVNNNQANIDENERIVRPEMRGPTLNNNNNNNNNINSILSGLKTKSIDVNDDNQSTISVDDIKDLKNMKQPKSKRKQKSDKNVVSLDI